MENILDLAGKEEQPLEVVPMSGYDFQVTFENAVQTFEDLKLVMEVEEAILTTENAELIAYHMGRLGVTEEDGSTLTTESALKGKEGFLARIKDIKNKIVAQSDATFGPLSAMYKNMTGKSVKTLEKLKAKLESGELVTVDKISDSDKEVINNKLGMFNAMGMSANAGDFIKLLQLPSELAKTVIPENSKFMEIIHKDFLAKVDNIKEAYEKGELPTAPNSVKFLKSIKGIEFKDGVEMLNGLPLKVFGKNLTFVTVYLEEGKLKVDTDTVMSKPVDVKPLAIADAIKVIDVAITEVTNNQKMVDELVKSTKGLLPKFANSDNMAAMVAKQGSGQGIFTNFSRLHRMAGYFFDATRNLSYDFYEINNFAQKLVNASTTKKPKGE